VQPNILGLFTSFKKQVAYTFFHNKASNVGMLHWTWWLLTLARYGRLYKVLQPNL